MTGGSPVLTAGLFLCLGFAAGHYLAVPSLPPPVSALPGRVAAVENQVAALSLRLVDLESRLPSPGPTPDPTPAPSGYAGPLNAVLVFPAAATDADKALASSPAVVAAFAAEGCTLTTYVENPADAATPEWVSLMKQFGPAPVVLWMTPAATVRATKPPAEESVLDDLYAIRGGNAKSARKPAGRRRP